METATKKQKGVHYTPQKLALFLAEQTANCFLARKANLALSQISILDPACGDGELLVALVGAIRSRGIGARFQLSGFDLDGGEVGKAKDRLSKFSNCDLDLRERDFLDWDFGGANSDLFDCVISNPPYVRTQVMGGKESQRLAEKFELSGRVDLYHAFTAAISDVLKPEGTLGLLTSNRFLSVKSGAAMRQLLLSNFNLQSVFDLGDTRLFDAAVLPVILTGTKHSDSKTDLDVEAKFCRVYRSELGGEEPAVCNLKQILELLSDPTHAGNVETEEGSFLIERGELAASDDSTWTLTNASTKKWLGQIRQHQVSTFGDLAEIKVGIKTTADSVFIRSDWQELKTKSPESKCLKPLITHYDAERWSIGKPIKKVLYPYQMKQAKRTPISLSKFPKAKSYLQTHRERLEGRKYVIEGGREWFEIWVPHQPAVWAAPKIVWPDISEQPKFFLDESGAIVNGDCYWIKLRDGVDTDWLYMMLAVANSTIATQFYDTVFHNKLYAGRRRFMTQYVKTFPLPEMKSELGKQIIASVKKQLLKPTEKRDSQIESLVQRIFGFID